MDEKRKKKYIGPFECECNNYIEAAIIFTTLNGKIKIANVFTGGELCVDCVA